MLLVHYKRGVFRTLNAIPTCFQPLAPSTLRVNVAKELKGLGSLEFKGEGEEGLVAADLWLNDVKIMLDGLHCSKVEKLDGIVSLLRGQARVWWTNVTMRLRKVVNRVKALERAQNEMFGEQKAQTFKRVGASTSLAPSKRSRDSDFNLRIGRNQLHLPLKDQMNVDCLCYVTAENSVRVSNELEAGHPKLAAFTVTVVTLVSLSIAVVEAVVVLALCHVISFPFTEGQTVAKSVSDLCPFLAVTLVLNGVQPVLSRVAVGCGWQTFVAYLNVGCYYVVGIPLGCLLGFKYNLGAKVETTKKRLDKWDNEEPLLRGKDY
ncbi:UPF0051 protein ABCI8 [Hibiscus syriacus]|uniref:UPF0051 protein ABCI8 n=1 Tax=Hibiscus syriacus TaxID=106335 RepID=A0A6A2YGR1_HIBSY|nr:UPF0051 protein ABCI8 [Hibiscus syriacus]